MFATATSGEGQNTAFCNLSQVYCKSNFVLQLVVTKKNVSLHTATSVKCKIQCFATCRRFLQKATLFCNGQQRKKALFLFTLPEILFFEFAPFVFPCNVFFTALRRGFGEKFLQCRLLWRGQVPTSPRVLCNKRKGAKAIVSTCKFFQGAVSAPFCFAKNCLLFCQICFLFCQICRCVSKQRS